MSRHYLDLVCQRRAILMVLPSQTKNQNGDRRIVKHCGMRYIVIIPDHDASGYAHAEAIAEMSVGVAKSVHILKLAQHWRDCPVGGDISDWVAAGHTREELDALIASAPNWQHGKSPEATITAPVAVDQRFNLVHFENILLSTAPNYLVKGFIPREGLVVVWGDRPSAEKASGRSI